MFFGTTGLDGNKSVNQLSCLHALQLSIPQLILVYDVLLSPTAI